MQVLKINRDVWNKIIHESIVNIPWFTCKAEIGNCTHIHGQNCF